MEQLAIKKLQILHDRGRILAAVHDGPLTAGMPWAVGIVPARGQTLVAIEVPAAHPRAFDGGNCFPGFNYARGRVMVNDRLSRA